MDILKVLLESAQGGATDQIARNVGLDGKQATDVIGQLVPALAGGLQKNTQSADGLAGLVKALQAGGHQRYLDEPEALADSGAIDDGNGILGHILGSKEVSRQVARQAASNTGIDAGIIKKMLPLVATLVMGTLSKQTNAGSQLQEQAGGGLLGGLLGGGQGGGLDDLIGLAGKLLK